MKNRTTHRIAQTLTRAVVMMTCYIFLASAAYGQGGNSAYGNGGSGSGASCTATRLRLRFATSNDDLRGGQDNLNIVVYFTSGGYQITPNVNHSQNWPNNSVNIVDIWLNRPVPPNELRAVRLVHIADGGFNLTNLPELATPAAPIAIAQAFQSPDNWNMADMQVSAIGNGVGARIANHGFHRFTGSDPSLTILFSVPANICGSGRPTASGGGSGAPGGMNPALNPGGSGLRSITDGNASSKYGALTNDDVVKMAQQGVPESAILEKIKASPAKFDVSPEKMLALRRQGVSPRTLNFMVLNELLRRKGTSGGNTNADELSPQPYPPKSKANAGGTTNADELSPQPYPPKGTLLNSGAQQTLLGTQANSTAGDSSKSALLPAAQRPAITDGNMADGSVKASASGMPARQTSALNGDGKTAITDGTKAAVTAPVMMPKPSPGQIGASQTMSATGNSGNAKALAPRQAITVGSPSNTNSTGINSAVAAMRGPSQVNLQVAAECAKDPSLRILGVSGSGQPITFTAGHQYVIWGCSFGPDNPDNAVYLSDGESFVWFLEKISWSTNSVVVLVPNATPASNLMLFVLGQNGNSKLNGVVLSNQ